MLKTNTLHAQPRPQLVLEELEPRILFSADAATLLAGNPWSPDAEVRVLESSTANPNQNQTATQQTAKTHEIVFVDTRVNHYQQLVNDIQAGKNGERTIDIVLLDANRDGIAQITETLSRSHNLDAVHLISHGSDGSLDIGNSQLNFQSLIVNQDAISQWGNAFTTNGDFLIYGCNVAETQFGQSFIDYLSGLTGADVAASEDLTGLASLGGDWELEATTGAIETPIAVGASLQQNWAHVLAVAVDATSTGTGTGSSITVSHTTSGSERLMLVGISMANPGANTVSSVTWNGTALTYVGSREIGSGSDEARVEMWQLVAPQTGTANLVVNFTGAISSGATVGVTTFTGVDQTTPTANFNSNSGDSSTASVTVASTTDDLVFSVVSFESGTNYNLTPGGSQTERWELFQTNANGGGSTQTGATSTSVSWGNGGNDNQWALAAVSVQAPKTTANNDTAATPMNTQVIINVAGNDTDPQGDTLTVLDLSKPSHGTATSSGGNITYTPTTSYTGSDRLTYRLTDGNEGLTHYWKLDGSGTDSIGSSNGTLNGGPTTTTGRFGNALQFDESNDYVSIPDFTYGTSFTLSFDFNLSDNSGSFYQYIYSHGNVNTANSLNVYFGEASEAGLPNKLRTSVMDGNDAATAMDVDAVALGLIDGNWHTYTLTVSSTGGAVVYLDGVARVSNANVAKDGVNPTGSAYLGGRNDLNIDRFYGGKLDSVALYNSALSAGEVAARAAGGRLVGTLDLMVAGAASANTVPGAQTTNEDTARVFSSGNGNQISIADSDAGGANNQITLSVSNGTLTLAGTAGLSFVSGDGTADATMTFRGTASAINTALNGLSYSPTANWNGIDTLTVATKDSVLLSLDIDANLKGRYTFENTGALGTDTSPAAGYAGTPTNASAVVDSTRGKVLSLAGNGYIETTGHFANPTNVTLAAWVNLTSIDTEGAEVISLGDSLALRLDNTWGGVSGFYYDGSDWQNINSGRYLAGTGWHHVAYTFNDTGNAHKLYIDGVEVASATASTSISYTLGANSYIGKHGDGATTWDFNGLIDDARVYSRVLTASEIATLATDLAMTDTDTVAVTVAPVNDAPTSTGGLVFGIEDTAKIFSWSEFNISDVDTAIGANTAVRVLTLPADGILQYHNGSTWLAISVNQVLTKSTLDAGLVRFVPDTNETGYDGYGAPGVGNDFQTYAQFNFAPVQTTAITIVNPGAESQALADGDWNNSATGWTTSGAGAGAQNTVSQIFPNDHDSSLYANAGATLSQTLGTTFNSSNNYSLSFEVGWRGDNNGYFTAPDFRVELWAGGTRVGYVDQTAVTMVKGSFVSGTLAVDGTSFSALNGQALEIRLVGVSSQSNFDNLSLTSFARATDLGATATMSVDITPANDAPVLADTALSMTVLEDAGAPSGAVGTLVSALVGGITDVDSGALKGIAITTTDETHGAWYYSTNAGSTWTAVGTVNASNSLLLASDANTRVYFAPSANWNGTVSAGFTFRGWDQTSGAAASKVSTSSNGGTTAFSSATDTVAVTVAAVNDAPTFGIGDGIVTTAIGANADSAYSVAWQPDGKIIVAGASSNGSNTDFALVRYNADGSLDTAFGGGDGIVTTALGPGHDTGRSVTLQPDGKIVVAGTSSNGSNDDFALARYNADGSLDTTFGGGDGIVTTALGPGHDTGRSVTLQPDGKIVVAGISSNGSNNDFALVRYNADGSLDTAFGGGDGIVTTALGANADSAYSVAWQPDGKIIVAGASFNGSNNDFALVRYNANGSLDTAFGGGDGIVTTALGPGYDFGLSVTLQPDGKIVVAGYSSNGSNDDFALARYNADGSLDTAFGGGDGIVTTALGAGYDSGQSVTLQPDGKIVVAGASSNGSNTDFALVRYNADGSLDTAFGGGDGIVTTALGASDDLAYGVTLLPDGKIVVAGYSSNGSDNDFALVRYNADGSLDSRFDPASSLNGSPTFVEGGAAVVLDADVQVYDPELSAADNFSGAELTLARNGGAHAQDVFSATGTLGSISAASGNLVVGGTTVGTYTQGAGTLVLTFNASATNALVNEAMRQIAYSNSSDAPAASVQINWTFDDGNSGAQGTGGTLTAIGSTTVNITAVNDAPINTVPVNRYTSLNTAVTFSGAGGNAIQIADVDAASNPVRVTLSVSNGTLTLASTTGLTLVGGANGSATLTYSGTVSALNTALNNGVTFNPTSNYRGLAQLTITTDDQGNTGGSALSDIDTVNVHVGAIVVTNLNDTANGDTTSIANLVASDGGDGISLREAILAANATPNVSGPDYIYFNIAGAGPHVINLGSALSTISSPVIIDASTEPDYSGTPVVVLNGGGTIEDGIRLYSGSGGSTIRGLVIQNFTRNGINIVQSDSNTIAGNWIGLNSTGTAAAANLTGINLWNSSNNILGGATAADRNIISGNTKQGIAIDTDNGTSTGNHIRGNYIGTNAAGTAAVGSSTSGIVLYAGASNVIGGTTAGYGNVISGSDWAGVEMASGASNTLIAGNLIGLNAAGTGVLGNLGGGISIQSGNNIIGGTTSAARNVITGGNSPGIIFKGTGATGNVVIGNYIGTDISGTVDINGTSQNNFASGIIMESGASGNRIGTNADGSNDAEERNIISGNNWYGVEMVGSGTSNNLVQGNYIGTDATGLVALGNLEGGVSFWNGASGNQVGSGLSGAGNVISGNKIGVFIANQVNNNKVQGNLIGLGADGSTAIGNSYTGIYVNNGGNTGANVTGNIIGTDADGNNDAGERNVISANQNGILLKDAQVTGNTIAGNYIGTDVTGSFVRGNTGQGIALWNGANNNTIGGTTAVSGNLISGNGDNGIAIADAGTSGNVVQGNRIGVNATGTARLGNGTQGIWINGGASGNIVGGTTAGAANVIGANTHAGVDISGPSTTGNTVAGNFIGTDATGTLNLSNETGVHIHNGASGNIIGGAATGSGNIIAFNTSSGVLVIDANSSGNAILRNSIHDNGGLGIDLGNDGVSANDTDDGDSGANNQQNFPVITSAVTNGAQLVLTGYLNSKPNTHYRIEFYSSTSGDGSGHGEGQTYLDHIEVATDASGNLSFNTTLSLSVANGAVITATATETNATYSSFTDTSEFALNLIAEAPNAAPAGTDGSISVTEDTVYIFSVSDFGFTDPNDSPANTLTAVKISTLPGAGTLTLNSVAVTAGQTVSVANINSGLLVFTPAANANGASYTSFTFQVQDDGGTANGGVDLDASANTLTFNVTAVNDAPVLATNTGATVAENSTGNVITAAMLATTDVDNSAAQLVYTVTGVPTHGTLLLNGVALAASGTFTQDDVNSSRLTYDHDGSETSADSFTFTVDDGAGATSGGTFNLTITAVNDGTPSITSDGGGASANLSVAENTTAVTTVTATDTDLPAQTLTYSISGGADAGLFTVNSSTGALSFVSAPDRELATDADGNHVYDVIVQVSDGTLTDTQAIAVTVTDVNESGVTTLSDTNGGADFVLENAANGTTVGLTAFTDDPDGTDTVSYSLDDNAGGRFAIDANSGVITVAGAIDREAAGTYDVIVRATSSDASFATRTFSITIGDVDEFDVGAVTDSNAAANSVAENAAVGTAVGVTAAATDADAANNTITYSLFDNDGGRFAIDGVSGIVTVAGAIDRETDGASRSITVRATSSDGSFTDQVFSIAITDVDEANVSAPTDSDASANAVDENAVNGTAVGVTAAASDADATTNTVTYTLFDSAGGRFAIDANTGVVTVANGSLLDREAAASHNITVRATSSDGSTADTVFTVNLNDLDEFNVGAVTDSNAAANSVAENAAVGTAVGLTAAATDADATTNTITYTLDDDAGGRFAVNASTGVVTVAAGLDYESATSHSITVRATSADTSFSTQSFTINLTDINEGALGAISDSNASADAVVENSAVSTTVGVTAHATDPDGTDTVSYSLDDNAGGRFAIDANSGVITVAGAIDREAAGTYDVIVRATSSDASFATRTFSITIGDVDEFDVGAVTDSNAAANSVAENAAVGTAVGVTAAATDADAANNTITYSLFDNDGGRFAIDGVSGIVTVAGAIDRETDGASRSITVRATSSDGSFTDQVFSIAITDVDEANVSAPADSDASANAVDENAANGTAVGVTASASDADATNNSVSFTLTDDAGGRFAIDLNTGIVTVANGSLLDREAAASHNITVRATSSDGSTADTVFTVSLNDLDEFNVGAVTDSNAAANSVAENAAVGTAVGLTAAATDADATNNTITYSLDNNAGSLFTIDSSTGVVSVAAALDYESATSHSIVVRAVSADGSFATQGFTVSVADVNESGVTTISDTNGGADFVLENAANGTTVGLTAFTHDPDGTDTVSYSLDDNAGGRFAIHATTGVITVAGAIDREAAGNYSITVRGTSTDTSTTTQVFNIAIGDVDEFDITPVVDTDATANTVNENAAIGTVVGVTAFASDADATTNTITYSLDNDAGGRFAINGSTGLVTVADGSLLDYETATSHSITVLATSSDGDSNSQTFNIAVTNLNDNPVVGPSDSDASANSVAENAANGSEVGVTALASDADSGATVTYSLTDNDGGRFAINSSTGLVTVADGSLLDYETDTSHSITVLATSSDGDSNSQTFSIAVANVNDAPTGSVTITGTATQGQTLTASNTLADADGLGTISYQWQAGGLNISGATGSSYLLTEAEVGKTISVIASYTDGHGTAESVSGVSGALVIHAVENTENKIVFGIDPGTTLSENELTPQKEQSGIPVKSTLLTSDNEKSVIAADSLVDNPDLSLVETEAVTPKASDENLFALPDSSAGFSVTIRQNAVVLIIDSSVNKSLKVIDELTMDQYFQQFDAYQLPEIALSDSGKVFSNQNVLSETGGKSEELIPEHLRQHAAEAAGLTVSVGVMLWSLRISNLLKVWIASMPAWRHVDLLSILRDDEDETDRQTHWSEQDMEANRDEHAVEQVLYTSAGEK